MKANKYDLMAYEISKKSRDKIKYLCRVNEDTLNRLRNIPLEQKDSVKIISAVLTYMDKIKANGYSEPKTEQEIEINKIVSSKEGKINYSVRLPQSLMEELKELDTPDTMIGKLNIALLEWVIQKEEELKGEIKWQI